MRVYVAGPMRGYPEFNFPAFLTAAAALAEGGHEPINPAQQDLDVGFIPEGLTGWEPLDELGFDLRASLAWDLDQVCAADAIYLLPGWERSSGARAEVAAAAALGLFAAEGVGEADPVWVPASTLAERLLNPAATRPAGASARIVGLSGYAGAGKDTAAAGLLADGWRRDAFADDMRSLTYQMNPTVDAAGTPVPLADLVDAYGWEIAKRSYPGVRVALQQFGQAVKDAAGETVWTDRVLGRVAGDTVITDVRFPFEADAIRAAGGVVIRVERPGYGPVNEHTSETALRDYTFDHVVVNDGTATDLADAVRAISARRYPALATV